MFNRKSDSALRDLFATVTVAEAANRWHVHPNTVLAAITAGKLVARKSGGIWLVTTDSLIRWWGKPDPPNLDSVEIVLPKWRRAS